MSTSNPDDLAAAPSAGFSTGSGTPDGLVGDTGPEFDGTAEPPPAPAPIDPESLAGGMQWSTSRVRAILTAKGELLHSVAAVDPESEEWRYTAADLGAIAGPLSRILNRYDVTRAAAGSGDEMAVAMGFAGYGMRSWSERRRALAELPDVEPEPYEPQTEAAAPTPAAPAADEPVYPDDRQPPPIAPRR